MKYLYRVILFFVLTALSVQAQPLPGTSNVRITDGNENASVRDTGASDSLNVAITDASGNQLATFPAAQSGTWNVNNIGGTVSLPTGAATAANQLPDGHNVTVDNATIAVTQSSTWSNRLTDGTDTAEVLNLATNDPLSVAIVDGSGTQITSFGGGSQYTEGSTQSSIVGTAVLWEDTSDVVRAVSAAKPLPVNVVAGGAGDGAILDGVSSAIKATVVDYTNSNPVAVRLTDTNGDYTAAGGGTQYTEDVATAADPIGTQLIARRRDALTPETGTDGDNVAVNTTNKGELYVKHVDSVPVTDNGGALTVDNGGTFAVQAAQSGTWNVTNISGTVSLPTGAATAANQLPDNHQVTANLSAIDNAVLDAIEVDTTNIDTSLNTIEAAIDTDGTAATTSMTMMGGSDGTNAQILTTDTSGRMMAVGAGAANSATTGNPVLIGGTDGTNTRSLRTSTNGSLVIDSITNSITVGSHAVTNAGTFVVQDSQTITDNGGFTDGSSKVFSAGYIYDEVAGTALSENDAAAARITANRSQVATLEDGVTRGRYATVSAANALKVDGSAAIQPVSGTVTVTATDLDVQIGGSDSLTIGTFPDNEPFVISDTVETATIRDTGASDSLNVAITDASGNQITSFGGGTEYTDDTSTHATGSSVGGAMIAAATPTDSAVDANDLGIVAMSLDRRLHTDSNLQVANTDVGAGNPVPISAASLPLPSGAASSANQLPDNHQVTANLSAVDNAVLDAIDVDTSNIDTSLNNIETFTTDIPNILGADGATGPTKAISIAGTTSGGVLQEIEVDTAGQLQVDVLSIPTVTVGTLPALVAGTANIGDVDVLSLPAIPSGSNNIGDVDVLTLPALAAGTNNIGDVDVLSIAAGTNAIGNVGIVPRTTGGLVTYHLVSAGSTNATVVEASSGQLYGWYIYNSNVSARKVAFHNSASSPTAGASIFFSVVIPALSAANVFSETGIAFSSGIAITTVTGIADSDATAVAANDLTINLFYSQ